MNDLIYKLDKSREDIEDLLCQHRGLVYYLLGTMRLYNDQDAESAAYEALWDAINLFDVFGDVPFSSFACKCMKNAVNDVLRERSAQKRSLYIAVELTEDINIFYTDEVCTAETLAKVNALFTWYITEFVTGGLARNILLVWHSSTFEMSATEVAKACKTTPSYVSRVQCAFRAFLGNRLHT